MWGMRRRMCVMRRYVCGMRRSVCGGGNEKQCVEGVKECVGE